jgi:hypothetical protein
VPVSFASDRPSGYERTFAASRPVDHEAGPVDDEAGPDDDYAADDDDDAGADDAGADDDHARSDDDSHPHPGRRGCSREPGDLLDDLFLGCEPHRR